MSNQAAQKITNILLISEQLSIIDFIEKTLKSAYLLNLHKSSESSEVKMILSGGDIDLVLIDDDQNNLVSVGSVATALKELNLSLPILQLQSRQQPQSDYLNQGASLVCPLTDAVAVRHSVALLLNLAAANSQQQENEKKLADFKHKFDDLYETLADPICYLQDGYFIDCNQAFLRTFEVADKEELDSFSILDFVGRKSMNPFKKHLRQSERIDQTATPVTFNMQTKSGEPLEFIALSKPARFASESVVQFYLRSAAESNHGGGNAYDATTGLMNNEQMKITIKQHQKKGTDSAAIAYILLRNYRDVWASDGLKEAEKLMQNVARHVQKQTPAQTEMARYTDDAILCYLPGVTSEKMQQLLTGIASSLRQLTPENMVRMVHPDCFFSHQSMTADDSLLVIISQLFKSVRSNALSDAGDVVSQSSAINVAKTDNQRLTVLKNALTSSGFVLRYQPIAGFTPDEFERYQGQVSLSKAVSEDYTLDGLISLAERHSLMHKIDQWMINSLLNQVLSLDVSERAAIRLFIPISADALKQEKFLPWLLEQLKHTGLKGEHFIFELTLDNIKQAYRGAKRFSQTIQSYGAAVAIQNLNRITEESEQMINEIKPSVFKLDLRELDSLDEVEEPNVMNPICAKAKSIGATLIAENLTSPAQLSRIWPYQITLIQGKGMTPILDELNYDFNSLAI